MPDRYGFDHLPDRGRTFHRCIEEGCEYPGYGVFVSAADRARHHRKHVREREKAAEKTRIENLAKARKTAQQQRRENDLAYRQKGDA